MNAPWREKPLDEWSIVGMNHYHVDGEKRLFVAMTKDGRCITEEGVDDKYLWNRLWHKATQSVLPKPLGLSDEQVQKILSSAK
jgi:hypothetical protein